MEDLGGGLVAALRRRGAGRTAISDGETVLSGHEAADRADALARELSRRMGGERAPVLLLTSNRAGDLVGLVAILRAGGVAVPLHRGAAAPTAAAVRAQTGARLVLNARPDLPAPLAAPDPVSRLAAPAAPGAPLPDGAGIVVFTSGSTGEPKGVVLSTERFAGKLAAIQSVLGFAEGEETLAALQLGFSFGQWVSLLALLRGGSVRLFDKPRPEALLPCLGRAHRLAAVPTTLRALLGADPARWAGSVVTGGEALAPPLGRALRAAWPEARVADVYGLTETGTSDFFVTPERFDAELGTIGRAGEGIGWRIAPGNDELQIRTPYGMLGYLGRPDLTAAAFEGPWLRTGDAARVLPSGAVALTGRLKEIVNRAGNKISPLEIEAVFGAHPRVAAALAAGCPDPERGEALHLLVVPRAGEAPEAAELMAWAAGRIERHKLPDAIHFADTLPTGATGKADRAALRRAIAGGGWRGV